MFRTRLVVTTILAAALVAVAGAQDQRTFTLKLKNEKNEPVPFFQEMTTEVSQHIKVQGQDLTQQQKSVFYYQWTPEKEEKVKEGTEEVTKIKLKQKIEGLKMTIDISGNPINYDSTKPDQPGATSNPGLAEFFKNLKDAEFTVTLGKNYKVEKVEGRETFIGKLGTGSGQMEPLLKQVLTEDVLKQMADPTFGFFPETPKSKGEKWERKTHLNLGPIGSYDLTYKFTYVEPEKEGAHKDFDKIEVETSITYTAPKDAAGQLTFRVKDGSTLTSDPAGSKGVIYYDPKNQRIEEAVINIKLKGTLTVIIGGAETKVELAQEQKTTIRTSDQSFLAPKKEEPKPMP